MHFDGTRWRSIPVPNVGIIQDVSADSPTDAWAVGRSILHWDGSSWSIVDVPKRALYTAISATSSTDVWVGGLVESRRFVPHTHGWFPFTEHFDGSTWEVVPTPYERSYGLPRRLGRDLAERRMGRRLLQPAHNDDALGWLDVEDRFEPCSRESIQHLLGDRGRRDNCMGGWASLRTPHPFADMSVGRIEVGSRSRSFVRQLEPDRCLGLVIERRVVHRERAHVESRHRALGWPRRQHGARAREAPISGTGRPQGRRRHLIKRRVGCRMVEHSPASSPADVADALGRLDMEP